MKKWILSLTAITLVGAALPAPSDAIGLPWGKKNKQEKTAQPAQAQPEASSVGQSGQSQPGTALSQPAPQEQQPAVPQVQVRSPLTDETNSLKVEDPIESPMLPPDKTFVAVDDPKNPLGITISAEKLNRAADLISQKKYKEAEQMLNPLKDWLVEATEAHINLHKTLKGLPSAQVQAELEKQLALQFALLRDKAFFQLGMLGVGQHNYNTAVKNLSRVVQSQPRSPMGAQAYEVLQQIGFTEKIQLREEKKTQ